MKFKGIPSDFSNFLKNTLTTLKKRIKKLFSSKFNKKYDK